MKTQIKQSAALVFCVVMALLLARAINGEVLSVAVLACENNANATYDEFVRGIPDMLMTGLAHNDGIQVVERVQIDKALASMAIEQQWLDRNRSLAVGKWLQADAVALASFTEKNGTFRLDVRLISTSTGKQIVAESTQGQVRDLLSCIDQICRHLGNSWSQKSRGNISTDKTPGQVVIEFQVKIALFSERDFYHQRCRIYLDDKLVSESPIIREMNSSYVLFSREVPLGNHVIVVEHGYVDPNGKWLQPIPFQPHPFLVSVRNGALHKISYYYRIGSIRENFEYGGDKTVHGYIKKVL